MGSSDCNTRGVKRRLEEYEEDEAKKKFVLDPEFLLISYHESVGSSSFFSSSDSGSEEEEEEKEVDNIPIFSWDDVTQGDLLGSGVYASTYKGLLHLPAPDHQKNHLTVAIKVLKRQKVRELMDEAKLLRDIDGAGGVPRLHGIIRTDPLAIIMSFCPGVLLSDYLTGDKSSEVTREVLRGLDLALDELHGRGYVHGDLHCGNVIVNDTHGGVEVHLIDVGKTRKIDGNLKGQDIERDRSVVDNLAMNVRGWDGQG